MFFLDVPFYLLYRGIHSIINFGSFGSVKEARRHREERTNNTFLFKNLKLEITADSGNEIQNVTEGTDQTSGGCSLC
jgi:hypothetical protein